MLKKFLKDHRSKGIVPVSLVVRNYKASGSYELVENFLDYATSINCHYLKFHEWNRVVDIDIDNIVINGDEGPIISIRHSLKNFISCNDFYNNNELLWVGMSPKVFQKSLGMLVDKDDIKLRRDGGMTYIYYPFNGNNIYDYFNVR